MNIGYSLILLLILLAKLLRKHCTYYNSKQQVKPTTKHAKHHKHHDKYNVVNKGNLSYIDTCWEEVRKHT